MKGSYILLIRFPRAREITLGGLGQRNFPAGWYAYVGSAMGGFRSRLAHHLKSEKKLHWHIDYLLQYSSISAIFISESMKKTECSIARALADSFESFPGFGCSDCKCKSHLFFSSHEKALKSGIIKAFSVLEYPVKLCDVDRENIID